MGQGSFPGAVSPWQAFWEESQAVIHERRHAGPGSPTQGLTHGRYLAATETLDSSPSWVTDSTFLEAMFLICAFKKAIKFHRIIWICLELE